MNKNIVGIVIIVIILILGVILFTRNSPNDSSNPTATTTVNVTTETHNTTEQVATSTVNNHATSSASAATPIVKAITLTASNFKYDKSEIRVNKGDTIRLTLNNSEGSHDVKIDEFDVATKQIQAGSTDTVEFVADKTGSFEYYCSVGNHRQMGMRGTLIVK